MAQLIVRNLEAGVKSHLRRRARRHGQSMEAEVRDILRDAAHQEEDSPGGLGSEIAALFHGIGANAEIPELRGREIKPARFDQ